MYPSQAAALHVLVLIETDSEEEQCLHLSLNQIKWEEVVEEEEE
jgi:hypothetical protein